MQIRLAVYTVVHPGVRRFVADWYRSVANQTDAKFDLWISVDGLDVAEVKNLIGEEPTAEWLVARQGETPAEIRFKAIQHLVQNYTGVVFVDSDDVLSPSRIEFARKSLRESDVTGCALTVINETGQKLPVKFQPNPADDLDSLLPRYNVFGCSNTSYRAETLRSCLPIGRNCELLDWFLATSAWMAGARLSFDFTARMFYRQYSANTARVLPPFSVEDVRRAGELVRSHYRELKDLMPKTLPVKRQALEESAHRVEVFCQTMRSDPCRLARYVAAINQLPPRYVWWWTVAHPQLENLWKS